MDKRVLDLWLTELRSGKYKQGTRRLKHGDEYCCLGILCEVHAKETGQSFSEDDSYLGDLRVLPSKVMEWSGISDSEGGHILIHNKEHLLTAHNDAGVSFNVIADALEKFGLRGTS